MPNQSICWRTALVLSTIVFFCGGLAKTGVGSAKALPLMFSTEGVQSNCSATTDAEIVTAIQEKIKADKRFDDQWQHINVSSKNRVVTLSGWLKGSVQVNALIKFARTTKCVRRVVSKLRNHLTIGCGPGQKPCGDTCIDRNEDCNLMQKQGD